MNIKIVIISKRDEQNKTKNKKQANHLTNMRLDGL